MNTPIATKIAALAAALMINSLIIAAVARLFDGQSHRVSTVVALARATSPPALGDALDRRIPRKPGHAA